MGGAVRRSECAKMKLKRLCFFVKQCVRQKNKNSSMWCSGHNGQRDQTLVGRKFTRQYQRRTDQRTFQTVNISPFGLFLYLLPFKDHYWYDFSARHKSKFITILCAILLRKHFRTPPTPILPVPVDSIDFFLLYFITFASFLLHIYRQFILFTLSTWLQIHVVECSRYIIYSKDRKSVTLITDWPKNLFLRLVKILQYKHLKILCSEGLAYKSDYGFIEFYIYIFVLSTKARIFDEFVPTG